MIGYYVHHQGRGHLNRMSSIASHLAEPLTVLSSLPRPEGGPAWLQLPADDTGSSFVQATANGTLHWVPRHHDGLRGRMALVASWIAETVPACVVVDVSVEVALFCRLLGIPTVVMAMRGDRTDRPHRTAYDSADALIAPWTNDFADPAWPASWQDKTFYAGPISRLATAHRPARSGQGGPRRVLALWGTGGGRDSSASFTTAQLDAAVRSTPDWSWRWAGGTGADAVPPEEVAELLGWADVVVTHAGQNAVAEVAAHRIPAVVIADARPHGEQLDTATALDAAGLAIGLPRWPDDDDWPALLTAAAQLDGQAWAQWLPSDGAARAAGFLDETAAMLRGTTARSA